MSKFIGKSECLKALYILLSSTQLDLLQIRSLFELFCIFSKGSGMNDDSSDCGSIVLLFTKQLLGFDHDKDVSDLADDILSYMKNALYGSEFRSKIFAMISVFYLNRNRIDLAKEFALQSFSFDRNNVNSEIVCLYCNIAQKNIDSKISFLFSTSLPEFQRFFKE
jgi:hypothetical protein